LTERIARPATPNVKTVYSYFDSGDADTNPWELQTITDNTGRQTVFNYTGARVTSVVENDRVAGPSSLDRTTTIQHDVIGNVSGVTLPDGAQWRYFYEEATKPRRLTRMIAPLQVGPEGGPYEPWEERLFYDGTGRVSRWELRNSDTGSLADWEDLVSTHTRNIPPVDMGTTANPATPVLIMHANKATVARPSADPAVASVSTTLKLDRFGNITEVAESNPARTTTYNRNVDGQLTSIVDPLGRTTSFDYTPAGDLQRIRFADNTQIQYGYDTRFAYARITAITDQPGRSRSSPTTHWGSLAMSPVSASTRRTCTTRAEMSEPFRTLAPGRL